jgi:hypothetical protein
VIAATQAIASFSEETSHQRPSPKLLIHGHATYSPVEDAAFLWEKAQNLQQNRASAHPLRGTKTPKSPLFAPIAQKVTHIAPTLVISTN